MSFLRKAGALLALVLATAGSAGAYTNEPALEAVASRFAQQPVEVWCYEDDEPGAPEWYSAWGYVYPDWPVEHMDPAVCRGALGIANHDPAVPDWEKALGALVLTHESYHLRLNLRQNRLNEAATECRAIRHAKYAMQFLGATPAEADALMPYALALHWRLAAKVPEYNLERCKVPNWY